MTAPGGTHLSGSVVTGTTNRFRTASFFAHSVVIPPRFQPEREKLDVAFRVTDPNRSVRGGRVLYTVTPRSGDRLEEVTVHATPLPAGLLVAGEHRLPEGLRWDGVISQGLAARVGTRVDPGHCPVRVRVEVWNRSATPPRPARELGSAFLANGATVSSSEPAATWMDLIVSARWDKEWVIPHGAYQDAADEAEGEAAMHIEVQNLAEGSRVELRVVRLGAPAEPSTDEEYTSSRSALPELQPGLQGAVVRGGRVVLPDGRPPFVRMNHHARHWHRGGDNLYAFEIGVGAEPTRWFRASERDHQQRERACLRLKVFVVLECGPHGRGAGDAARIRGVSQAAAFLNATKLYRAKVLLGFPGIVRWVEYFERAHLFIWRGHGMTWCKHPDHPEATHAPPTGSYRPEAKDCYHSGFVPDRFVCPDQLLETRHARATRAADVVHYGKGHADHFGGCGHAERTESILNLGTVGEVKCVLRSWLPAYRPSGVDPARFAPEPATSAAASAAAAAVASADRGRVPLRIADTEGAHIYVSHAQPRRLLFWGSGCRTLTTRALGDRLLAEGFEHYAGWQYSVEHTAATDLMLVVLRYLVEGPPGEPAQSEYDPSRLVRAFRAAARRPYPAGFHPRIMGRGVDPRPDPAAVERALR